MHSTGISCIVAIGFYCEISHVQIMVLYELKKKYDKYVYKEFLQWCDVGSLANLLCTCKEFRDCPILSNVIIGKCEDGTAGRILGRLHPWSKSVHSGYTIKKRLHIEYILKKVKEEEEKDVLENLFVVPSITWYALPDWRDYLYIPRHLPVGEDYYAFKTIRIISKSDVVMNCWGDSVVHLGFGDFEMDIFSTFFCPKIQRFFDRISFKSDDPSFCVLIKVVVANLSREEVITIEQFQPRLFQVNSGTVWGGDGDCRMVMAVMNDGREVKPLFCGDIILDRKRVDMLVNQVKAIEM